MEMSSKKTGRDNDVELQCESNKEWCNRYRPRTTRESKVKKCEELHRKCHDYFTEVL